jgi:hypothetical protein
MAPKKKTPAKKTAKKAAPVKKAIKKKSAVRDVAELPLIAAPHRHA